MKRSIKRTSAAVGAASVVLLGIVALSVSGGFGSALAANHNESQGAPESLALLAYPQNGKTDAVPSVTKKQTDSWGESGLDPSTTRLLGKDKAAAYWAGLDNSGNVCVIAVLPSGGASSSCKTVADFNKYGIELSHEQPGKGQYAEVYLVPDGVDLTSVQGFVVPEGSAATAEQPLHTIGTNAFAGDTRGMSSQKKLATGESIGSGSFELHLISE